MVLAPKDFTQRREGAKGKTGLAGEWAEGRVGV